MKHIILSLLLMASTAGTAFGQVAPVVDWGSAGKGEKVPATPTPPTPPPPPPAAGASQFDCDTVTRMSWEQPRLDDGTPQPGPRQVRRCRRDGISLEVTPPSN